MKLRWRGVDHSLMAMLSVWKNSLDYCCTFLPTATTTWTTSAAAATTTATTANKSTATTVLHK